MELTDLKSLHQRAKKKFEPYYVLGAENARYVEGKHWTTAEIEEHEADFRHAYSIPLYATKLNRILAEQRNNRTKLKAKPRGVEDEIVAEVGNHVIDYVEDLNRFKYIESDVYYDGLGVLWGVIHGRIDTSKNPRGEVVFEKIPFDEVMWDTNCTDYSIEKGATWFERFGWFTRNWIQDNLNISQETLRKIPKTDDGKKTDWVRNDKGQELIKIIWHYEKVYKTVYKVKNFATGEFYRTKDKKVADDFLAQQKVLLRKEITGGVVGRPSKDIDDRIDNDLKVLTTKDVFWELTVFGEQTILKEAKNIGEKLPYVIYFSMIRDGNPYTLTDLVKDSQRAFDRRISMIDKALVKNIKGNNYYINTKLLDKAEAKDPDKLMKRLSKGGQYVKGVMDASGKKGIEPIERQIDINAEMSQLAYIQTLIEDEMGGRTFQGLEAGHKQTATEAKLMESSAQMSLMLPQDNLMRWKELVGDLMWYLIGQTYKEGRQFTILGESLTEEVKKGFEKTGIYEQSVIDPATGWMKLTSQLTPLKDAKVNITVDTEADTKDSRERKQSVILALNDYFLQRGMPSMDGQIVTKYLDADATIKQMISEYIGNINKQQQEAGFKAEQQQNTENTIALAEAIGKNGNQLE